MKVFITGGSGFLGKEFIKILKEINIPYINFDLRPSEGDIYHVQGDIRKVDDIRKSIEDCNSIVHLAAEHRDDVSPLSLYDEVNIHGTKNICQVASEKKIKMIVFTSSVAVYGFAKTQCDENGKIDYFNDYGRTKYAAEQVLNSWVNEKKDDRSLTIIRPTVIFGYGNRGNVYNLIHQIASNKFLMIGNGKNKKSLAYVENVASFIHKILDNPKCGSEVYNYVDNPDFNMHDLVDLIRNTLNLKPKYNLNVPYPIGLFAGYILDIFAKIINKKLPISSIRVKKFCMNTSFSSQKMQEIFDPPNKLKDALIRTIQSEFLK
jgi:nucleoside-diphosphate-sugar epimerase